MALLVRRGWINNGPSVPSPTAKSKVIFQSFSKSSLARLRHLAREMPRILLADDRTVKQTGWQKVIDDAKSVQAVGVAPSGYYGWPWYIASGTGPG